MKTVRGTVMTTATCQHLGETNVFALAVDGEIIASSQADAEGNWELTLPPSADSIRFEHEGFVSKKLPIYADMPRKVCLLEDDLIGYHDRISYVPGDGVIAYVHSSTPYRARVCRYGLAVQPTMDLGEHAPLIQQVPDARIVESGLSWKESFRYELPSDMAPGLYSLQLTPSNSDTPHFGIPFLVSSPPSSYGKEAKLLVLSNTNTWQSYNSWGGRSRYTNAEDGIVTSSQRSRQLPRFRRLVQRLVPAGARSNLRKITGGTGPVTLSDNPGWWQFKRLAIQRPFPKCSLVEQDVFKPFGSHLAAGEWRLLAWLEREGVTYDLVSAHELERDPELLKHYSAVILSTHCEYWSKRMFVGLKNFNEAGGWVLNLSGNSIFREVEFYGDGSIRCASTSFQESVADESKVLGTRFDMRGYRTCAPFIVEASEHWAFVGTGLQSGDAFASRSLNHPMLAKGERYDALQLSSPDEMDQWLETGGSGWETDKLTGAIRDGVVLLAKGKNPNEGGADMIIIEGEGDLGGVFSASSITYGGSLLVDQSASQVTHNILRRALAGELLKG